MASAVFSFTAAPLPVEHVHLMHIMPDVAVEVGRTDRAKLERLYNANVPSKKLISSSLKPVLRMASKPALRALAAA
jgi:hypothetical protein